jgi:hypothetical protein
MIIKYSEDIILDDWVEDRIGYKRRNSITLNDQLETKILASIDYYYFIGNQVVFCDKKFALENKFFINFYDDFYFMNQLFENRMMSDVPGNIKNSVDLFLIRMSKIRAIV